MYNTLSQGYALLAYLYVGLLLGLVYDLLRIPRILLDRRVVTCLCDLVFVAVLGTVSYFVFHIADDGRPRLYGAALMLSGAAVQQWAFGLPICKRIVKRRT